MQFHIARGHIAGHNVSWASKRANIFCVSGANFASATNVELAGKQGNISVRYNVSSFADIHNPNFVSRNTVKGKAL